MQSPRPEQGSFMPGPIHWPVTRAEALAEQLQNVLSLKERNIRSILCQNMSPLWRKSNDQRVILTSHRCTHISHKQVYRCHDIWQHYRSLSVNEMFRLFSHPLFNFCCPLVTVCAYLLTVTRWTQNISINGDSFVESCGFDSHCSHFFSPSGFTDRLVINHSLSFEPHFELSLKEKHI